MVIVEHSERHFPLPPEVQLLISQDRTLTPRQKEMIRARDGNRCMFPGPHKCNQSDQTLHVHHITPFSLGIKFMGLSNAAVDDPRNLISVCEEIHVGGRHNPLSLVLHPDAVKARRAYAQDRQSYQKMFKDREELMKQGKLYHNAAYDTQMKTIAYRQTMTAVENRSFSWEAFRDAGKKELPTRRTRPAKSA